MPVQWKSTCELALLVRGPRTTDDCSTCSSGVCISYFSQCSAKTLTGVNKSQEFILVYGSRRNSSSWEEGMPAGWEVSHGEYTVNQREMNAHAPLAFAPHLPKPGTSSHLKWVFPPCSNLESLSQICSETGLQLTINGRDHRLPKPNHPYPRLWEDLEIQALHGTDVTTSMRRLWKFISLIREMNTSVYILVQMMFLSIVYVAQDWSAKTSLKLSKYWLTYKSQKYTSREKIWGNRRDTENRDAKER